MNLGTHHVAIPHPSPSSEGKACTYFVLPEQENCSPRNDVILFYHCLL